MAYADYDYYTNTYLGNSISETDFPRLALRASSFLDYYTQGRATGNMEAVKMACCAVAEQQQIIDTAQKLAAQSLAAADGAEVQSESVGSWSKSYRSGGDSANSALTTIQNAKASLAAAAAQYLANTGLLYRGGCKECDCEGWL